MFGNLKKMHFIGIGGIGMSGLAELLNHWGYTVSGSDINYSDNILRLEKSGIRIFIGHHPKNLKDADVVIYTSAVSSDNPELSKARKLGIPTIKRAKMLGEILRIRPNSIAVSGTHGKTTTTSLIGHIFTEAGCDPLIISGGVIQKLNSNVRSGNGDTIILEADEYDQSFLQLYPTHIVITTIDEEHLEIYSDMDNLKVKFTEFANRVPFYGKVIANEDDAHVKEILPEITVPLLTYSLKREADLQVKNITLQQSHSTFNVYRNGNQLGTISLPLPGRHNIQNCLAAILISMEYELPFKTIQQAIETFRGVQRRFEIVYQSEDLVLVDDYAHHPGEIKATLQAARLGWKRRIVAIFQPHLYSRTQKLYKRFAEELEHADVLIILDVYPAREKPVPGVSGQLIEGILRTKGMSNVHYVHKLAEVPNLIKSLYKPGDMIITLGAGNVNTIIKTIKQDLTTGG
ncbi:MAG TPA: UDP-N-acetylmuramate--L-alanine ligase [Candidatus Marinimicrobia bacterium]|mgnify:CR=1 FL=1|nr:UDP-N-acetylmuramate--L-alanine ligase [Candidatus Neomarinimicrobiota bacterium]